MQTYYVNSLEDSGIGTLRDAIAQKTPQYIIFTVSGIIKIKSRLWIGTDNTIIDGAMAPGAIIITGEMVYVRAKNVFIRYLTMCGNRIDKSIDSLWVFSTYNVIIDHCSLYAGSDETLSVTKSEDVCISNCIIANPINNTGHGYGSIMSGIDENSTIYIFNNAYVNCAARSPRFNLGNFVMHSNIIYNYGHLSAYTANLKRSILILINNSFIPGKDTLHPERIINMPSTRSDQSIYVDDNVLIGNDEITEDNKLGIVNIENAILLEYDRTNKFKIVSDLHPRSFSKEYKKMLRRIDKLSRKLRKISISDNYKILENIGSNMYNHRADINTINQIKNNTGNIITEAIDNVDYYFQQINTPTTQRKKKLHMYSIGSYIDKSSDIKVVKFVKHLFKKKHE